MEWALAVVGAALVWSLMALADRLNFIRNELKEIQGQIAGLQSLRGDLNSMASHLATLSNYAEELTGLTSSEVNKRSLDRIRKRLVDSANQWEAAGRPDSA